MKSKKRAQQNTWRAFEDARAFIHSLNLKGQSEWRIWVKNGNCPKDIPASPSWTYKKAGWISWGDWLGTKRIANQNKVYRPFEEAHTFAIKLDLKNKDDWQKWIKNNVLPDDIPADPSRVYRGKGWSGWGDWLGTGRVAYFNRVYRPFAEAREYVHNLGLKNASEWKAWSNSKERPDDIPLTPRWVYKNKGWVSLGDWLGTRNRKGGYRSFSDSHVFAQSLGLKSKDDWAEWAKTKERPVNVPANPRDVYKNNGWIGWGDWLGTRNRRGNNRPFVEARTFARSLGLKTASAWISWAKSDERPLDIPANPGEAYKHKGWKGWGDWLGTGLIANQNIRFRPFDSARGFACKLGLKNKNEWMHWAKSKARPANIPANPESVYKNKGWLGWGNWLGTGRVANQNKTYRPFNKARIFSRSLGLKNQNDWGAWAKSSARPVDIPAHPPRVYEDEGWLSWGDWLGTDRVANQKMIYRSFHDARVFVHHLDLQNRTDWLVWAKSEARPIDIPLNPSGVYKNKGWAGWGDWLGTGRIANFNRIYRSFSEARTFVRGLGLQNVTEWDNWAKSNARPDDIPASPKRTYKSKGWMGWGDWLGIVNVWNRNSALSFLYGIKPVLQNLQPVELYTIMRQNGMVTASKNPSNTNAPLIKSIRDLCSSSNSEADFDALIAEIERENQRADESIEEDENTEIEIIEPSNEDDLPALRSMQALKAVDELVQAGITSDEETIEFLISNRVSGLWQDTLNNGGAFNLEALRGETGGVYFETIRNRFLSQYDGAQSLAIPKGYDFRVKGAVAPPNLMQKLAAYRILTEKRLGNWSGVGAGKTLSAILASRVIDARLTVIVAFNSTIEAWGQRIKEAFPDSAILIKERESISIRQNQHTYLILNFESFQQPDSAAMVTRLVEQHKIDFVVLDEIQSVKQRTPKVTSKRRQVVSGLLTAASEKNPDLCVLGMSATPVINNLYEAKALLELVKGVTFDELETFSSIPNAIAMHEKLILYGIRYRPAYNQTIETEIKEIQGNDFLPRLVKLRKGAILDLEKVLLDAKISAILLALKKGTLIYTHYLTGLVTPLRHAIEKAGFTVGLFTGEDKSGLEDFKHGKVDVLIGSVPIGTGVDGLQYVCNRMIVVSLPWTSAEYEQLIGRLYRQGSQFDKVEVVIPQVILEHNGDTWSWDKMRMNRIQYKKTLADAAIDGVIPGGELSSPETMYKKAREALQAWIQRIEEDGVAIIERAQLKVPLPKEAAHIMKRRFGDLSVMNSRFNIAYSSTTHERLQANPEEWYLYHTLYREARKDWAEIPFEKIAKSLKKRPDWIIGDFGCGEAKLAHLLPNKIHSFDHVAINEKVTACDISHVPVEDGVLDVVVFSLSLMGLNYADYLKEAYRTLRFGGMLKIAEPINRWEAKRPELLALISENEFSLVGNVEESHQFFYIDAIKMDGQ